jgi:hypothetical protein
MSGIYWLFAVALTLRDQWDMYAIVALIFGWVLVAYTTIQEKSFRPAVIVSSVLHAAAHVLVLVLAAHWLKGWNETYLAAPGQWFDVWIWLGKLLVEMGVIGFLVGSTLFGWNMLITCRWFRMNRNDAFSALRIGAYNNFVRMRLTEDSVQFFAIGLEQVPARDDWIENPQHGAATPGEPRFVAKQGLRPHLIETFTIIPTPKQPGSHSP